MSKKFSDLPAVFHQGEVSLHKSLGIKDRLEDLGKRMIRDYMPDQHRTFFEQLSWVHLGAVDSQGHPWAVVRTGEAGFLNTPDDKTLSIRSIALPGEPEDLQLSVGSKVSIVGLDPATRRRNRLNATVFKNTKDLLVFHVDQSFGNCPKYIQKRDTDFTAKIPASVLSERTSLDQTDTEILNRADTLYIASRTDQFTDDPRRGVDINHRGGLPGFVTIIDDATIEIPDYKGNNFFNTFGNILQDSRVGVQVIDFTTATLLNLQGNAEILTLENTELPPPDTGRRLRISLQSVSRGTGAFPYSLSEVEYSPFL